MANPPPAYGVLLLLFWVLTLSGSLMAVMTGALAVVTLLALTSATLIAPGLLLKRREILFWRPVWGSLAYLSTVDLPIRTFVLIDLTTGSASKLLSTRLGGLVGANTYFLALGALWIIGLVLGELMMSRKGVESKKNLLLTIAGLDVTLIFVSLPYVCRGDLLDGLLSLICTSVVLGSAIFIGALGSAGALENRGRSAMSLRDLTFYALPSIAASLAFRVEYGGSLLVALSLYYLVVLVGSAYLSRRISPLIAWLYVSLLALNPLLIERLALNVLLTSP